MVGVPGDREGRAQHNAEKPNKNEREPERAAQRIKRLLAEQGEDDCGRQAYAQKPFARDCFTELTRVFCCHERPATT